MKRSLPIRFGVLPLMALLGCSTSPCADFLDSFFPVKPPTNAIQGRGGVCNPPNVGPGGALSPSAVPGGMPPALTPAVPAPGTVAPAPGTTLPPPLSDAATSTAPFPLMSTPVNPGGPDLKPLPVPPPAEPPRF